MDISNKTINQNNVPEGCIMITNLIKNKVKESSIQKIVINDSLDFDLIEDGFYTINQYFIWSEEYFNTFSIEDLNLLYNNLYVFSNNKICKYNFQINKLVPCNIQELIEINKNSKTNVKTECKDIFFIDQLKQCQLYYFNLILNKYTYKCNIYVPDSLVNTYKSASGWSTYSDKIFSYTQQNIDFPGTRA